MEIFKHIIPNELNIYFHIKYLFLILHFLYILLSNVIFSINIKNLAIILNHLFNFHDILMFIIFIIKLLN